MGNEKEAITIGALIHDIGKLVRRAGLREKTDKHTFAAVCSLKMFKSTVKGFSHNFKTSSTTITKPI